MTAAAAQAAAPRGYVQIPRSLLYSSGHSALAVWAWSMYETLMPHGLGGGRVPTVARRRFVAERAGTSTTALDDARRELLAPAAGGPYLSRSAPRGSKRSVKHACLRLPRETGEAFAPVPSWTLDLVWAGRRRPAGRISPDAWRLYAACVDRACRDGKPKAFDATVGRLGAALRASAATGRRRLTELEAAGLVEVTERPGGWLSIHAILDVDQSAEIAETYAREGRRRIQPRQDPSQITAFAPGKNRQEALAGSGTPQESPTRETPVEEAPEVPAKGEQTRRYARARTTTEAGKPKTPHKGRPAPKRRRVPRAAVELYQTLPAELTRHVPEHGSRRVLSAIAAEMAHRSSAELTDRIARNWEHWRYRISASEPVRDPVAVAIRLTRRGIDCPDVRCEDGHHLDLEAPCKACAQLTAERIPGPVEEPAGERPGAARILRRAPATRLGGDDVPHQDRPGRVDVPTATAPKPQVDVARYGALARALLKARTNTEREAILARHGHADARSA